MHFSANICRTVLTTFDIIGVDFSNAGKILKTFKPKIIAEKMAVDQKTKDQNPQVPPKARLNIPPMDAIT